MVYISEVIAALEQWAPRATQQSYDNVGLQVGDAHAGLTRAIIALDLTPAVIEEAIAARAELIITHHPLIFKPLQSVTAQDWHGSLILNLAKAGIALYCIHTNLDAARDGVSFALAKQIGLQDISFLKPVKDTLFKLVTFVPADHLDAVQTALASAGAGKIGDYDACAFVTEGTGYFRPGPAANPYVGEINKRASVNEFRVEVEVSRWLLPAVLNALLEAHPYEEVAYDMYPLHQKSTQIGMGATGVLEKPEPLADFLNRVATALSTNGLRYAGDLTKRVHRVAVCGGSGSDLISDALRAGADAFLTADVTYHRYFDVLSTAGAPRMALIDAIHYETEACTEDLLQVWLSKRFADVDWVKTGVQTSPIRTFFAS